MTVWSSLRPETKDEMVPAPPCTVWHTPLTHDCVKVEPLGFAVALPAAKLPVEGGGLWAGVVEGAAPAGVAGGEVPAGAGEAGGAAVGQLMADSVLTPQDQLVGTTIACRPDCLVQSTLALPLALYGRAIATCKSVVQRVRKAVSKWFNMQISFRGPDKYYAFHRLMLPAHPMIAFLAVGESEGSLAIVVRSGAVPDVRSHVAWGPVASVLPKKLPVSVVPPPPSTCTVWSPTMLSLTPPEVSWRESIPDP